MKKALAGLCIIAIIINVLFSMVIDTSDNKNGDDGTGGGGNDDIVISEDFTVTVPDKKIGDIAQYDYTIFAEMYNENKTSGNWSKYTLNAEGQLIDEITPIIKRKDGFNMEHSVQNSHEETAAKFDITIDGSDSQPFTAHGALDVSRNEYIDLNENIILQTATNAHVEIDQIPRLDREISYDGSMRNYPNPNEEQQETLDEMIYLGNKQLKIDDSDSILWTIDTDDEEVSEWYTQVYNWTVIGGERVSGYNTLIINITSGFFQGWLPFVKKVWIANEVSFPVKTFTRTNMSYEDEESKFYFILEHIRVLIDSPSSFIQGSEDIPWDSCNDASHFPQRHPEGEFKDWEYMPVSGSGFDESSFKFKPEDAVEYAKKNSDGLVQFLNKYDDVVVDWGVYKVTKDYKAEADLTGRSGSFNWNLSFGYKPTYDERVEARESDEYPHWGYYVNLTHNVTKEIGIDSYSELTKIINEGQENYGSSSLSKKDVASEALTLASSEIILKLDPDIEREIYGLNDEIDFDETTYSLAMAGITPSNNPGMEIIETITGITFPSSKFSWAIQKGSVYLSGNTFSAAVDAENGQLLYVLEVTGTELYGIFG